MDLEAIWQTTSHSAHYNSNNGITWLARSSDMKVLFCLLIFFTSCTLQADWYKQQQDIMGTRISVELWHHNAELRESCGNRIFEEMHRIDNLMSPYKSHSEISYINNNAAISTIEISEEMAMLIGQSIEFSILSGGAFDITFASIGYRYDYRQKLQPDDNFIASNLDAINYKNITTKEYYIRMPNKYNWNEILIHKQPNASGLK